MRATSLVLCVAVATASVSSGCATPWEEAREAHGAIRVGMTKPEVIDAAGPPRRELLRENSRVWIYSYRDSDARLFWLFLVFPAMFVFLPLGAIERGLLYCVTLSIYDDGGPLWWTWEGLVGLIKGDPPARFNVIFKQGVVDRITPIWDPKEARKRKRRARQ